MHYEVLFLCHDDDKLSLKHQTNDYDQADHFFWAMVTKLTRGHDTDVHTWQLTLSYDVVTKHPDKPDTIEKNYKLHFSKM